MLFFRFFQRHRLESSRFFRNFEFYSGRFKTVQTLSDFSKFFFFFGSLWLFQMLLRIVSNSSKFFKILSKTPSGILKILTNCSRFLQNFCRFSQILQEFYTFQILSNFSASLQSPAKSFSFFYIFLDSLKFSQILPGILTILSNFWILFRSFYNHGDTCRSLLSFQDFSRFFVFSQIPTGFLKFLQILSESLRFLPSSQSL